MRKALPLYYRNCGYSHSAHLAVRCSYKHRKEGRL
nr:MAG TPA: hypothetical protein [Caudoviricetes sp.]